ncbi:hypothetical protein SAMN05192575_11340 [Nocardioides alpinus]|uniref:Uncharacterized protein n=1 Tax=Nocardioides alpinus TaxID=748909 RepID=A0A1I1B8A1_9ACTN|nr:hypothetical protein [Nocardioides alpinus]PKH40175.1 hypothetical protein CXG46_13540 [Nocardioides alpinus]SFB44753.1 hypothetical protein SAMN05192575_11340 [Nocardioides alpinus]
MTLDEAVAAVEASLDDDRLRVDRHRAREDEAAFLLLVLDTSRGRLEDDRPIANGPRLVAKVDGTVTRLTLPDALARADQMPLAGE